MRLLKEGDHIRLKVRTIGGWKGAGTVIRDQILTDDVVVFERDGKEPHDRCVASRHEVAVLRKRQFA